VVVTSRTAAAFAMVVIVLSSKMVVSLTGVQDLHLNQVENETHDSNDEHDVSLDLGRLEESFGCLSKEPDGHDPDARYGDECANDLSSVPSVGQVVGALFLGNF